MIAAVLLAAVALIAAGAAWLYRRMRREAVVDVKVEAAGVKEADAVKVADATLATERAKDPIDVVNERFGTKQKAP